MLISDQIYHNKVSSWTASLSLPSVDSTPAYFYLIFLRRALCSRYYFAKQSMLSLRRRWPRGYSLGVSSRYCWRQGKKTSSSKLSTKSINTKQNSIQLCTAYRVNVLSCSRNFDRSLDMRAPDIICPSNVAKVVRHRPMQHIRVRSMFLAFRYRWIFR